MTNRYHIIAILLLAAGLLAACSASNEPEQKQRAEIAVRTGVSGMLRKMTTINNNTALQAQDIKIDAYYHGSDDKYLDGVKLHYDNGSEPAAWKFWNNEEPGAQVHYYWPILGSDYIPAEGDPIPVSSLDFVGFCPFDKPEYISTPEYDPEEGASFTCNMSDYMTLESQASMTEYLVAVLNEQTLATQTAASGALPLVFKHPLAQVKFTITAASGTHVQINSIKIADLHTSGTCTYNGTTMNWSNCSGSDSLKIVQELKIGGTTTTSSVAVLPDNYGTKYLTVNATWDDWSDVTISDYGTDVSFNWEPGHAYTYNLTLDSIGLKVDSVKYTEQW